MRKQPLAFLLLLSALSVLMALVGAVQLPAVAQGSDPASQTETPALPPTLNANAVTATPTFTPTKLPPPTRTPTTTPTASQPPTSSPSPSLTPSATPTWTPTITLPPPIATATPTPSIEGIIGTLMQNSYLIAVGIVLVLVVVVLLALLWLWRGRGRKMPPTAAHAYLVSSETPNLIFPIVKDSVTIGRAKGCDIQITEKMKLPGADTLSRWHARLEKRGERWVLVDGVQPNQPSTNGVFVNGMRTRENYLREGVEIRLGQVAFTFYTQLPTAQPAQGGAR